MSTWITVLLRAIEPDGLDGFVGPKRSWVGIKGFKEACKVSIEEDKHDSNKGAVLISNNNNESKISDQDNSRVYHKGEDIEEDVEEAILSLLKSVDHVMTQLEELVPPEVVHDDVEYDESD